MTAAPTDLAPATPARRIRNKWNVASAITLFGGMAAVFLYGLVYAAVVIGSNPVTGDQAGWNVLAFIIMPFMGFTIGYHSVFALAAAVLATIGLVRFGRNWLGIVLLVVSLLMSLKFFELIRLIF